MARNLRYLNILLPLGIKGTQKTAEYSMETKLQDVKAHCLPTNDNFSNDHLPMKRIIKKVIFSLFSLLSRHLTNKEA